MEIAETFKEDLDLAIEDNPASFVVKVPNKDEVSVNLGSGVISSSFEEISVEGLIGELATRTILQSNGKLESGDNLFIVRREDFGEVSLNNDMEVVYDGLTYRVVFYTVDPFGVAVYLIARK